MASNVWQPVETAPENTVVLCYRATGAGGSWRIATAASGAESQRCRPVSSGYRYLPADALVPDPRSAQATGVVKDEGCR